MLRGLFFEAWGSLTSLKSQTWDPHLKVPPRGLVLRIFTSWKKSIDLNWIWTCEPWISRRAGYPETTEADIEFSISFPIYCVNLPECLTILCFHHHFKYKLAKYIFCYFLYMHCWLCCFTLIFQLLVHALSMKVCISMNRFISIVDL